MGDTYVPILKDTKDPHYRYKMPKLTAKVEGSGNGIKTVITNMSAIAKALGRPPAYPTKYFGCELGAQVTTANDIYVVNGSHEPEKLSNLLYGFINRFVLCSTCKNPETTLTIVNQNIKQKCIACGHECIIPKPLHKLTTFIINHPPDGSNPKASKKEAKKSKKSEQQNGGTAASLSPKEEHHKSGGNGGGFDDDLNDAGGNDDFDDDDFDQQDLTTSALSDRLKDLHGEFSGAGYMSSSKESANLFYNLVKEKKEAQLLGDVNVHKELLREAEKMEFKEKATLILCELLFTEDIIEEIKTYRLLLLRFCNENRKAQKYLLGGFEKLVGDVYKDKLFANSLKVLKQLYDEDIVDEEVVIEWASKESKKYVDKKVSKQIREKVAPFVKWLKEAEVEEDEDEEEEASENGHDDEDEEEDDDEENDNEQHVTKETSKKASKTTTTTTTAASSKQDTNQKKAAAPTTNGGNGQHGADEDDDDDDMFEFSHRVSGIHIQTVKETAPVKAVNSDVTTSSAAAAKQDEEDLDIDNI